MFLKVLLIHSIFSAKISFATFVRIRITPYIYLMESNEKEMSVMIEGFNYTIDREGNVYSLAHGSKKIKQQAKANGKVYVQLYNSHGIKVHKFVHRLVAEAFLDNPIGSKFVLHRNGDSTDNRVENLMWAQSKHIEVGIKGERWKKVPGMDGVMASSKGRIRQDGYIMKPVKHSDGLDRVVLLHYGIKTVELLKQSAWGFANRKVESRYILTQEQASEVKRDYQKGKVTLVKLAQKYGVSKSAIHDIIIGRSWANIKPAEDLTLKSRRSPSPHDTVQLLKQGHVVELEYKELGQHITYLCRKTKMIFVKMHECSDNEGFVFIERIDKK